MEQKKHYDIMDIMFEDLDDDIKKKIYNELKKNHDHHTIDDFNNLCFYKHDEWYKYEIERFLDTVDECLFDRYSLIRVMKPEDKNRMYTFLLCVQKKMQHQSNSSICNIKYLKNIRL